MVRSFPPSCLGSYTVTLGPVPGAPAASSHGGRQPGDPTPDDGELHLSGRLGVDEVDQAGQLVGVGGRQDAMAEVEHVALVTRPRPAPP